MPLKIVILAAGQGKRMHSSLPKVLHPLGGKPILEHIIDTANQLNPPQIFVIYGHQGERIKQSLSHCAVTWVEQQQQLGTGDAVKQIQDYLNEDDQVLVLLGDTPLITATTLQNFINNTSSQQLGLITVVTNHPAGLGRIQRDEQGEVVSIVECKDATPAQKQIQEINTGIMLIPAAKLKTWLQQITNNNAQGEYYLTDIFELARKQQVTIQAFQAENVEEVSGVNNRAQLIALERCYQQKLAEQFLLQGVTIMDPKRFDVRGRLTVGRDVIIDVNTIFEGNVCLGNHVVIGANCIISNSQIADNTVIRPNTVIDEAVIEENCVIGPFARIRPQTQLANHVHIGNFVEIKKSHIDEGSKINHLSYVGDATVGKKVNIGAGTITCNYDGVNKFQTIIQDGAFIGSDTQLVAPVTIGTNATIGAGSTITKNVPDEKLTLSRAKQLTVENWKRPEKS